MTDAEYGRKLDELDRLINDPEVPIQPDRVWSLLAEIATREDRTGVPRRPADRRQMR
ncbi:MAG TPA: peptide chain release factor 1 [Acetobacteraceae bacterium]|nr:peptide chain release factor 1 [Acetobacteraceae bacterium]